jgi:hypothetical protein
MSTCRFMHQNHLAGPAGLSVSSARPGLVALAAPEALGAAVCYASGGHGGDQDQEFWVEIDSTAGSGEVGAATFRWQRAGREAWEAGGVVTSRAWTPLAQGVKVRWSPGQGQDLCLGDRWSILASARQGPARLVDRDRDTCWQTIGCAGEWVRADLGAAKRVTALVLADHNLSAGAAAVLKGNHADAWESPAYVQALEVIRPHLVFFLDQTHRFWRLELADPDNPDGYLRASQLYLGGSFSPQRSFTSGYRRGALAGGRPAAGDAGGADGVARALARYYDLGFPRLEPSDAAAMEEMMAAVHQPASGGLHPLFFTPFEHQPGDTLYCLPQAGLDRRRAPGGRWEARLQLREVVRSDV